MIGMIIMATYSAILAATFAYTHGVEVSAPFTAGLIVICAMICKD